MENRKKRKVLTKEGVNTLPLFLPVDKCPEMSWVGVSVERTDDRKKVTGKLAYAADIPKEGFLHGKILRSPYPHALIKSIHIDQAKSTPGVAAVLTAADLPGEKYFGAIIAEQPILCWDKVRFVGDGVALVAAETEEIANHALSLIQVEYEPLPSVFDPREALKPAAPLVHEKGNLLLHNKLRKGDVIKGFAEAEVVIERTYQTPFVEHGYLEPDIVLAIPQFDGTMVIEGPMQAPFTVRKNVATALGVQMNMVRVKATPMGGGFGGKDDSPIDLSCRAAILAWYTGRPVCIALEREEVTLQTSKRHPHIMEIKIGAKKDGTLVAFEGTIFNEEGAYAGLGPLIPPAGGVNVHSMIMLPGPYEIPNCKVDAYLVYTNHPVGGAMRGFGAPQVCFAHESIIDELALELGVNPLELRRRNAFKQGSTTATGQILDQSIALLETIESCAQSFEWNRRFQPSADIDKKQTRRRGVGIGMGWYRTSFGVTSDGCGANVSVLGDGSVLLYSGVTEMGQGAFTVLRQICAEELGVGIEKVRLVQPDTDLVPESGPTVASRSTTLMGNAIILACEPIKHSIMKTAAELLSVPSENLKAENNYVFEKDNPDHHVKFVDVVKGCIIKGRRLIGQGWWTPPEVSLDPETGQGNPYFVYSYSTHMAEVMVDIETGEVEVTDYVAAFDVGKAIHPKALEGQIEGGVAMGIGFALMEEIVLQKGYIKNLSFKDFLIPTILDIPDIKPIILEATNKFGPFGAKGIGEMPNIPVAPAILNAIANACGARIRSLPADPEKVFREINQADRIHKR